MDGNGIYVCMGCKGDPPFRKWAIKRTLIIVCTLYTYCRQECDGVQCISAEVKIRFSGCAVNCPGTSNFARSLAVLSGHVHRTRPSISQSVWSLLQNCIHNNVLAM